MYPITHTLMASFRLAIVLSHPIQYYAPWFRQLSQTSALTVKVCYLWDFGVRACTDTSFQTEIAWDIPLLEGYDHAFVPNRSCQPGTGQFWGLDNPDLQPQLRAYAPDAVLMMNYNYASCYRLLWQWRETPLLFKGDSHVLQVPKGLTAALKRQWISLVYQRFSACLYVGQANRDYFTYHGVPTERLFHAPHAVENQRFQADATAATADWKRQLGIPSVHRVILFSGKFIEKKRPLDLLIAFQRARLDNTSLLFVGGGPLEDNLRTAAKTIPNVYFAPFQNQSLMPRTYAIATLFVLPSYGHSETWGLAVNEAMCQGKPIVVSDHVGCAADLVQPGRNGWICSAGDPTALAATLQDALSDEARLTRYGRYSREHIRNYSYRQTTQGLLAALAACHQRPVRLLSQTRSQTSIPQTTE